MKLSVKRTMHSNAILKVISCILGYAFWTVLSATHTNTVRVDVPVCFYAQEDRHDIKAPETIKVTLSGKRSDLLAVDTKALAIHVNAAQLHNGHNQLVINNETLFLPDTVKLVNYCPSNSVIDVQEKSSVQA